MGVPTLSRVVWNEGMHLAQHHFQAQNRYFENTIHFALSAVFPEFYGFVALEMDHDAIWDGKVSLLRASGVMPDGLAFELGEGDEAPEPLDVKGVVDPGAGAQLIRLVIPEYDRRKANCQSTPGEANSTRFRAEKISLFDETTGEDERAVSVTQKNFRLEIGSEPAEGVISIPVARVRGDDSGHFTYDPRFVPPCLQILGSSRLMSVLARLVDMLDSKADTLRSQGIGGRSGAAELASHELTSFWLLHAVYSGLGSLRHHVESGRVHPQTVYEDLIRLAGALCTFSLDTDPRSIPSYDHDLPEEVFDGLEQHIRSHLEIVIPESYVSIALTRSDTNLHTAALEDERLIGASEWVLRVSSSAATETIIDAVPRKVKVGSAEDVMRLVAEGRPALSLAHLPSPPTTIAPRVGSQYFRIGRKGPVWKLIEGRSTVGVFVPDALPEVEVEILVVP